MNEYTHRIFSDWLDKSGDLSFLSDNDKCHYTVINGKIIRVD